MQKMFTKAGFLPVFLLLVVLPFISKAQTAVFINEIHYDNTGTDTGEAIEIAGPAGTNLTGWSLVLYNGSGGAVYDTDALSGIIPDLGNGFGTITLNYPSNGIQNGAPDGIALVDNNGTVIQFLSYEGSFTAVGGAANGLTSTNIGVSETGSEAAGFSLQLTGNGTDYEDFTWAPPSTATFAAVNNGQTFQGGGTPINVLINEIRIDQNGTDNDEYFELKGNAGTSLNGLFYLVIGDGTGGSGVIEAAVDLTGNTIPSDGVFLAAESTFALGIADMVTNLNFENSDNVTHLLVQDFTGTDGQDLDTNDDGVLDITPWTQIVDAVGLVATVGSGDLLYATTTIGPDGTFVPGHIYRSLSDNSWQMGDFASFDEDTPGAENQIVLPPVNVLINEIRIDQNGTDNDEYFELKAAPGTSLNQLYYLVIGDSGTEDSGVIEAVVNLTGSTIPSDSIFLVAESTFTLGTPDLVSNLNFENSDNVTHLLVQNFSGTDGQDLDTDNDGVLDITPWTNLPDAVALIETVGSENLVYSTTRVGPDGTFVPGHIYRDANNVWQMGDFASFTNDTPGETNTPPAPSVVTIAEARALPNGSIVTVRGTFTVSTQFGGPAYIQDSTGGIPVFDASIHGAGIFSVGDSIQITAVRTVFNGQIQLGSVSAIIDLGLASQPIQPRAITLSQLATYEGQLVAVQNATFPNPGDLLYPNANFTLTDASGSGQLRIDGDTDVATKVQPDSCSIVGVIGSFQGTVQLLPRFIADLPCAEDFVPPVDSVSKELSLDVVAWNIEWFGHPSEGPTDNQLQKERVKQVIQQLDADVYAFVEISDSTLMNQLATELNGYAVVYSNAVSRPLDNDPNAQKLAFLYKTSVVNVIETRPLLKSIHPLYNGGDDSFLTDYPDPDRTRFYASGRLPFLMVADITLNGVTQRVNFVGLHARANNSSEAQGTYDMRKYDVELLKDTLDRYFANENLILLGDYNDDVDETVANIPSTISSYIEYALDSVAVSGDANFYQIVTKALSEAGLRTFITSENVIDHISITDELMANYITNSARVNLEVFNTSYANTTSDHLPVSARFLLDRSFEVESFTLIDAVSNQEIREINAGDTLNLFELPLLLNIRANVLAEQTGSVDFTLKKANYTILTRTENQIPYAVFGDINGDYVGLPFLPGTYQISATPYTEANKGGEAGESLSLNFVFVYKNTTQITYTLIDADTDQEIGPIQDGDVIDLNQIGNTSITIRANTSPQKAGSVVFKLSGAKSHSFIDNLAPYTLFNDWKGNYFGFKPKVGNYVLKAKATTLPFGLGAGSEEFSISFSVVKSSSSSLQAQAFNVNISPNPTSSQVKLEIDLGQNQGELMIFNPQGNLIEQCLIQKQATKYYNLAVKGKGIFIAQVKCGDTIETYRILVQ